MTDRQNNGRVRTSRPRRDRPTDPPTGDGFWPGPVTVCKRCCCLVPAAEQAQRIHREHHAQVDAGLPR